MKPKIIQVAQVLLKLQDKGYTVFFDYSGHVAYFYIRIYKGMWKPKKKPVYDTRIDLKRDKPNWDELLGYIENLKEYKPEKKSVK